MTDFFQAKEAASQAGIGIETLRFYEKKELISPHSKTDSGYRLFTEREIHKLKFIKAAQNSGFKLSEIKELLTLQSAGGSDCHSVRDQVKDKLEEVQEKILALSQIQNSLEKLLNSCSGEDPISDCPILNHFAKEAS